MLCTLSAVFNLFYSHSCNREMMCCASRIMPKHKIPRLPNILCKMIDKFPGWHNHQPCLLLNMRLWLIHHLSRLPVLSTGARGYGIIHCRMVFTICVIICLSEYRHIFKHKEDMVIVIRTCLAIIDCTGCVTVS